MSGQQEPSKVNANINSMLGTAEETAAAAVGATSYEQAGKQRREAGDAEYKEAQAQGFAEGAVDQISGKKDQVVGALSGDDAKANAGQLQKEQGRAQKELNRPS